jgi:hypothetical protein
MCFGAGAEGMPEREAAKWHVSKRSGSEWPQLPLAAHLSRCQRSFRVDQANYRFRHGWQLRIATGCRPMAESDA